MATITPMATKPWNIGEPGGPAGPFYSVVTQSGGIVALQVVTREMAERIASIPVLTDKVDRTQYELGAARRQYEGSQSALKKAMAELTEARGEALNVRPEVRRFALEMETRLQENDHKGGWKGECWMHLLDMLRDEVAELAHEVVMAEVGQRDRIVTEAADVANFAMMIADACGGLE